MQPLSICNFWMWWRGQISALLPRAVKAAVDRRYPYPDIFLGTAGLEVSARVRGSGASDQRELLAQTVSLDEAVTAARSAINLWRKGVRLVLGSDACLIRSVTLPAAAVERVGDILDLQLPQIVPLPASEILHDWYVIADSRERGRCVAEHVVVRRAMVAPLIDRLAAADVPVASVRVRTPNGEFLPVDLMRGYGSAPHTRLSTSMAISRALAIAVAALVVAIAVMGFQSQTEAIAELDSRIAALRPEALKVQLKLKAQQEASRAAASLLARRQKNYTLIEIWEELTRILPDDVWLVGLSVEDGAVMITGVARSASELILRIDETAMFEGARFDSAVVRDPVEKSERFSIRVNLASRPEQLSARKAELP